MKTTIREHITFTVPGKKTTVPIYIGKNVFKEIKTLISFNQYSSVLVIIDENVSKHWTQKIKELIGDDTSYLTIPPGEKNKTLSSVEKIWLTLSKKGFDRKSLVINIGGGMICDLGAYAASTYMRGIPFVQVPTTLLAQADAAIGGKTGFNFNGIKNLIGSFSYPVAIISDINFLSTLPKREYHSGFAEIIKHSVISDSKLFTYLNKTDFNSRNDKAIKKLVFTSSTIKCSIVNIDPHEKNERKKLNFGHTVGHAIEIISQDAYKPLLHGEAVAIGMIAESRISFLSGHLSENKFNAIENLVKKSRLPDEFSAKYKNEILKKMLSDKKNVKKRIYWVLLTNIGKVEVDVILPNDIVNEGLNYILK